MKKLMLCAFIIVLDANPETGVAGDLVGQIIRELPDAETVNLKTVESARRFRESAMNDARYRHEKRGELLLEQRKFLEAIREFDAALALAPQTDTVYVKKGIALVQSGRPTAAVTEFDKALQYTKRDPVWRWWPLHHKAVALGFAGRTRDAVHCFTKSIELNPTRDNHLGRAMAYAQLHEPDQALADIKAAQRYSPNDERLKELGRMIEAEFKRL